MFKVSKTYYVSFLGRGQRADWEGPEGRLGGARGQMGRGQRADGRQEDQVRTRGET